MPTNQAFPTVNGDACSWADIGITFNLAGSSNSPLDLEAIKWSGKVEVGEQRGTSGGRVMKTTAGSESSDASASFSREALQQLRELLETAAVALNLVRGDEVVISAVRFDILIQHTPLGSEAIYTTKLEGCRYLGDSDDMKQGNDADVVEITLNPTKVKRKSSTGRWLVLR